MIELQPEQDFELVRVIDAESGFTSDDDFVGTQTLSDDDTIIIKGQLSSVCKLKVVALVYNSSTSALMASQNAEEVTIQLVAKDNMKYLNDVVFEVEDSIVSNFGKIEPFSALKDVKLSVRLSAATIAADTDRTIAIFAKIERI